MDKDADFYQAHKDDPDVWGEPEGVRGQKPERRRLNAMVSIRLSPVEEDALRAEAKKRRVSVSALVRESILRELIPRSTVIHLTVTEATKLASEMVISEGIVVTAPPAAKLKRVGA